MEHWLYPGEMFRDNNPRAYEWNALIDSCYQSFGKRCIPDGAAFELPLHHLRPDIYEWFVQVAPATTLEGRWQRSAFEYYLLMSSDVALLFKLTWGGK